MRSSLPQIFRKDLNSIYKPQKQSKLFSLYLRTNNFTSTPGSNDQNRYDKKSRSRPNKSMDFALIEDNKFNTSDGFKTKTSFKNMSLNKNRQSHSKSFFIQQNQNENIEQVQNFKTIRKRVLQQLTMLQKSLEFVDKIQKTIKLDIQGFKQKSLEDLNVFQQQMMESLCHLRSSMKRFRKQTNNQIKINKQQVTFLAEQIAGFKQIYQTFQTQQNKMRFQLTSSNADLLLMH